MRVQGPAIISKNAFIGHGALVRANTIIGSECVVGHCTEIKSCILFPRSRAAHFNFIGDSIIGTGVILGAGTIISNREFQNTDNVIVNIDGNELHTGLRKLGAIIGDNVMTGSHSVLSPGSLVGPDSIIFPHVCVRKGLIKAGSIVNKDSYTD
jgi:UDP-N-acetylglucosamine diphosphorylase / glucose-1-phosphate thymidylyltransferase / UDP-N-acetylgalactosamine diphosphorylase / glucosamine-1-phosphate N-acetyltransferase / galactosamine-1-phosphate N-acetyltransferase